MPRRTVVCCRRGTVDGRSLRAAEKVEDKEEWPPKRKTAMGPVAG